MDENKEKNTNVKKFVEGVFSAEDNSAATLGKNRLGKYSDIAIRMFHTGVLTPREMLFPAVAQLANQILTAVNCYRTLYYVNVLKIDMAYVTVILMLIGIYDVLNNPLMGIAYDRTRTRWGKARPYIVLAAPLYFLSTAVLYAGAMFLGNSSGNDPKKIIFVFVVLFIQETFSTIYSLPRNNMLTLQTVNPGDRITVGLLQNYVGNIGSDIIFAMFMPVMELNNKGYIRQHRTKTVLLFL
ncbi:MAG: MFS transporter [Clostridia bacterium]|nr:MFS transporter [Clostridia bacterium]